MVQKQFCVTFLKKEKCNLVLIMESQIWGGWIKITMRTFFPRFPKRWNFSILQVFMINSTADWVGCPCPVSCFPKIAFIKWNYQDAVETVIHKVINRLNCFQGPLCTPLPPLGHCLEEGNYCCERSPHNATLCALPLPSESVFGCTGVGSRRAGSGGRGLSSLCTCPTPLLLGLMWAIFLRALQRPSSILLLVPQPQRRSLIC